MVTTNNGRNIVIQGLICRGSWNWTIQLTRCSHVTIENVKLCGSRVGNDDGVDPCNSSNVIVRNCFFRTDDDAIAVKGMARSEQEWMPMENLVFENIRINGEFPQNLAKIVPEVNNMWSRRGNPIMVPGNGPYVHNAVFRNIEVYGEHKEGTTWGTIIIGGLNERHNVQAITFENFTRYGQLLKSDSPNLDIRKFVDQVKFIGPDTTSQ